MAKKFGVLTLLLAVVVADRAVADLITGTFDDATWAHEPLEGANPIPGRHSVPTSAYVYAHEKWELPVQASSWGISGSKIFSGRVDPGPSVKAGQYWSWQDLDEAVLTATDTHWTIKMKVAGDYTWDGAKATAEAPTALAGHYSVYFGQIAGGASAKNWVIHVSSGDALSPGFDSDDTALYTNKTDNVTEYPPYGSDILETKESMGSESGFKGYDLEISGTGREEAQKVSDTEIELRYNFLDADGSSGEPTLDELMNLDYIYVSAGKSNPSAVGDFFANDHFLSTGSTSAEYDTILILNTAVPEPSSFLFLFCVSALCSTRHMVRRLRFADTNGTCEI